MSMFSSTEIWVSPVTRLSLATRLFISGIKQVPPGKTKPQFNRANQLPRRYSRVILPM